jgi:hypothetical protein
VRVVTEIISLWVKNVVEINMEFCVGFASKCFRMDRTSFLVQKAEEALEAMLSGFSVLVYGCGSKRMVMDGLGSVILHNLGGVNDVIVRIRGYDQTFPMIRTISASVFKGPRARAQQIRNQHDVLKAMTKLPKSMRVFFLIDSIDALPMKGNQEFFAKLSEIPNVHICASIDHCRSGLLWSPSQLRRFKWLWVEASTYHAYTAEVKDMVPVWDDVIEGKSEAASRSLALVLSSLTRSHSELFRLVAKLQLEESTRQVRGSDLLKQCKKNMIATNQHKMKQLLLELTDHRLVLNVKEKDTGNEIFWIPFDETKLEEIACGAGL